jgi:hypothetical protein
MILTGENRCTRRETCPSDTLSTTNLTRAGPESKPGLRGDRSVNKSELHLKTQPVPRSKTHSVSVIKTNKLMLYSEIIAVNAV